MTLLGMLSNVQASLVCLLLLTVGGSSAFNNANIAGSSSPQKLYSSAIASWDPRINPTVDNGCGGSYMQSLGALTGPNVPLGNKQEKSGEGKKGCGGSYMASLGVFPKEYVPLAKGKVDPANQKDTVVYQKSTGFMQQYQKNREKLLNQIQEKGASSDLKTTHTVTPDYDGSVHHDPFATMQQRVKERMERH